MTGGLPGTEARGWGTGADVGPGPLSLPRRWRLGERVLELDRPRVMGVVNLTPDSFSDGGRWRDVAEALDAARAMVDEGAAVIDVGGESTRPGAPEVPVREELRRILPFLERAGDLGVPLSVDTRKAEVAREALTAGARVVNDVSGFGHDPALAGVVAESGAGVVLMHMRGTPADMRERTAYRGPVGRAVADELARSLAQARAAGVDEEAVVLDPGIGFAKTAEQSLALLADLGPLRALGRPLLVGPSRKSFIGALTGAPPAGRLPGTLAACVSAYLEGARIFRVHDVAPAVQALTVAAAIHSTRAERGENDTR